MSRPTLNRTNPRKGIQYAVWGAVLTATYYVTGKYCLNGFNAQSFCMVWLAATALYALGFMVARGKVRELRVTRASLANLAGLGVTTGLGMILLYSGLKRIDPSFSAFLGRLLPVMTILLGVIFLKERLRAVELLPLALMLGGGFLSVAGRPREITVGALMTVLSLVCFSFHRLFIKMESHRMHTEALVFYRASLAWVVAAVWALAGGGLDFNVEVKYWIVLFPAAFVAGFAGNLLSFHAYKYMTLSRNALILMIQPLLVLPMAYIFLNKFPERRELAGGLLILVGAFAMVWIHFYSAKPSDRTGEGDTDGPAELGS